MALNRTETTLRLRATEGSGNYYTVKLVDKGGGIVIPEPDDTTGGSGISDAYVALTVEGVKYRWSLQDTEIGGTTYVTGIFTLSPDQAEPALDYIDLRLSDTWYRLSLEMVEDGDGNEFPTIVVGAGQPWITETNNPPNFMVFVANANYLKFVNTL